MEINSIDMINEILKHKVTVERAILELKNRLTKAPEGTLRAAKRPNGYQYYQMLKPHDTVGNYITRKNEYIAVQLAEKEYYTKLITALERQLKSINRFIKDYDPNEVYKVFGSLSESRRAIIKPEYPDDKEFVKQWLGTPYKKLGFRAGDSEYYTENNERVRSKSEIIIANTLKSHNIPYRYEFPLYSDGVLIAAPDFNCLNVRTRKEYYWEHLGMMGDEAYLNKNIKKIEQYTMAEDFDESRLILTFESDKHPLNTRIIEEKIRRYLI